MKHPVLVRLLGTKVFLRAFDQGEPKTMQWAIADNIKKPLASVSQLVSKGCRVAMDSDSSYILHKPSGDRRDLYVHGGVYYLSAWRRIEANATGDKNKPNAQALGTVAVEKPLSKSSFRRQALRP